jgi:hypothetical protein
MPWPYGNGFTRQSIPTRPQQNTTTISSDGGLPSHRKVKEQKEERKEGEKRQQQGNETKRTHPRRVSKLEIGGDLEMRTPDPPPSSRSIRSYHAPPWCVPILAFVLHAGDFLPLLLGSNTDLSLPCPPSPLYQPGFPFRVEYTSPYSCSMLEIQGSLYTDIPLLFPPSHPLPHNSVAYSLSGYMECSISSLSRAGTRLTE